MLDNILSPLYLSHSQFLILLFVVAVIHHFRKEFRTLLCHAHFYSVSNDSGTKLIS